MAFTENEQREISRLLAEGKSTSEITAHIGSIRLNAPSPVVTTPSPKERAETEIGKTQYSISETIEDIAGGFGNIKQSFSERQQIGKEADLARSMGQQGLLETEAQKVAQAGLLIGDVLFEAGLTGVKAFMTEQKEKNIGEDITGALQSVAETPAVQSTINWYQGLDDRTKRNLGIPMALLEFTGAKFLSKPISGALKGTKKVVGDTFDVAKRFDAPDVQLPNNLGTKIKDFRINISDIDESTKNAIARSTEADLDRHIEWNNAYKADKTNPSPLQQVGGIIEKDVFPKVTKAKDDVGKKMGDVLQEKGDLTIGGNVVGKQIDKLQKEISTRYGIQVSPSGKIIGTSNEWTKLDNASQKLVTDYIAELRKLGVKPNVRELDRFINWSQGDLYKQGKAINVLETADPAMVALLKEQTGTLNNALKNSDALKGTNYAELNQQWQKYNDMEFELNRSLGADARKSGTFVKSILSPTSDSSRVVRAIRDEFGIDLGKEAELAIFLMENSGDSKTLGLLNKLDLIAQKTDQFNLTNPATWLRTLREFSDLDGEELARQIIRQTREAEEAGRLPVGTTADAVDLAKREGVDLSQDTATPQQSAKNVPESLNNSNTERGKLGIILDRVTGKDLPNKEGGFVSIGGKTALTADEAVILSDAVVRLEKRKPLPNKLIEQIKKFYKDNDMQMPQQTPKEMLRDFKHWLKTSGRA